MRVPGLKQSFAPSGGRSRPAVYQPGRARLCHISGGRKRDQPKIQRVETNPMNANDAMLTELTTAQSGSTVEDNAPNAPAQPSFDLVVEAVAGGAVGNSGTPYTLTITAIDLTAVTAAPALNPTVTNPQAFDPAHGWKLSGSGPDFEYSQTFSITVPPPVPGGPLAGHTIQYVASLVSQNAQIVSIIQSDLFVLV